MIPRVSPVAGWPAPFTAGELALLRPYVTNTDQPIFALRNLPEEVVAVLFAYYSRSPGDLRRTLLRLIQEHHVHVETPCQVPATAGDALALARQKAQQFHEKYVVGYGHASVAEHAVVHLAIEGVSIVLSKVLEDTRLASFTEKSTRYVIFDRESFSREPRLMTSAHAALYADTCVHLLDTYSRLVDPVITAIRTEVPRREEQTEAAYATACRSKACDILRYLLPAATRTNIGLTINGRLLEHLLTKLLSHPLAEAQQIGAALKSEAQQILPTLIKYAAWNPYLAETRASMVQVTAQQLGHLAPAEVPAVSLVRYPEDAEDQLLAAIFYGYSSLPLTQILAEVRALSPDERIHILDKYVGRRGPHDQPLRALEHLTYTFDILVDFGAFRDIQRHRMCTQTPQESTAIHGYSTPMELVRYSLAPIFHACMARARHAYDTIVRDCPHEAPYVLPLAFRKRVLFTWNLRELHHFVQLRSGRQGHPSYRRIAREVFHALEQVHPLLARYIRVDLNEYPFARA